MDLRKKICTKCKVEKIFEDFPIKSAHSTGRNSYCKVCDAAHQREYWGKNKEDLKRRRKPYLQKYWRDPVNIQRSLKRASERNKLSPKTALRASLHNALKRRPTENPATPEQLLKLFHDQNGLCALSGIKMTWQTEKRIQPTSMSIDRIDSNGGYSLDNVRLVCHAINTFRGRMTDDELFAMALALIGNMKRPKLKLVS